MRNSPADPATTIRAYHDRTKHHLERYAAGPGGLDWATQPDPFRRFDGCPLTALPLPPQTGGIAFGDLATGRLPAPATLFPDPLGELLALSMGISAWKRYGQSRWALRCNPSSGNLHPTEAYVVLPSMNGLDAGVYHYRADEHALECRQTLAPSTAQRLQAVLPAAALLVGFSSIPWREAWKYGERAWRYCLLDLGHALGALRYAAAGLGWTVTALEHWADADLSRLLGLHREGDFRADEPEYPELLCLVHPDPPETPPVFALPTELLDGIAEGRWVGRANRLSASHAHAWPLVDQACRAAAKPATAVAEGWPESPSPSADERQVGARELILRRRSAQACDGVTSLDSADFLGLLDHSLPRPGIPPWGPEPLRPRIHLLLCVHRVTGLAPGLYLLARDPGETAALREAMRAEFEWQALEAAAAPPGLYRLIAADAREVAAQLACHQRIASDGAFSVAMLGEFDAALRLGAWSYRALLTEAGLVGQVLYLEAEAAGLQGTGIGCFFDDGLHRLMGLEDSRYQVVYQFTVGGALEDLRIASEPAYPDAERHMPTQGR